MNKVILGLMVVFVATGLIANVANASVIGGQDIIAAPASVADDAPGAENDHQQAFDEAQNVLLEEDLECDLGTVPAGTTVNSHMIFLNTSDNLKTVDNGVVWEFDGEIICVISDQNGTLEEASNSVLSSDSTTYPGGYRFRGIETHTDSYVVNGNEITVNMQVREPGDWMRVVTEWTDTEAPVAMCTETVNKSGKNIPKAGKGNGKGVGENEDGFYLVSAIDNFDENVKVRIIDSETGYDFGLFDSGTKIKYVEANGAEPSIKPAKKGIDYMLKGQGDAIVYAVDEANNQSEGTSCLVPNNPK